MRLFRSDKWRVNGKLTQVNIYQIGKKLVVAWEGGEKVIDHPSDTKICEALNS